MSVLAVRGIPCQCCHPLRRLSPAPALSSGRFGLVSAVNLHLQVYVHVVCVDVAGVGQPLWDHRQLRWLCGPSVVGGRGRRRSANAAKKCRLICKYYILFESVNWLFWIIERPRTKKNSSSCKRILCVARTYFCFVERIPLIYVIRNATTDKIDIISLQETTIKRTDN